MTEEEDPPLGCIAVTVKLELSSASVSSLRTSSCDPVLVTVAPSLTTSVSSLRTSSCDPVLVTVPSSLTLSVSSTAAGSSLIPKTEIVILAVVVAVPSERV